MLWTDPHQQFLVTVPARIARREFDVNPRHRCRRAQQIHGWGTDESRDERVHWFLVELLRAVDLLENTLVEHRHAIAHRHSLDLIVGHVHRGDLQVMLKFHDLRAGLHAELRIQVGERLVHQEHLRFPHDGTTHGDALALATGQILGLAIQQLLQAQNLCCVIHATRDFRLGPLGDLQCKTHVFAHRHVRVEGIVLKDHRDVPVLRLGTGDVLTPDGNPATGRILQAGKGTQRRGLPTSRRANEDEEFAVGNVQVKVRYAGAFRAGILDDYRFEFHIGHGRNHTAG